MPPLTLTTLRILPRSPTIVVGTPVQFTVTALRVNGDEVENPAGCRWSVNSGGGSVSAWGLYTARPTAGKAVVRVSHAKTGRYALVTIDCVVPVPEPEPDPDPVPEPDPEPPPPTPKRKVGLFAYSLSNDLVGPLWTGVIRGMHAGIVTEIDKVGAKGGIVIGAQGGYDKFLHPDYDPDWMTRWIESFAAIGPQLKLRWEKGWFLGVQGADDFFSKERWPKKGLSIAELTRIAGVWKRVLPWIDVGLRARPRQFTGDVPQGYRFMICQYRHWGGLGSPEQFRDAELKLALARGHDIAWSMNWQHGGNVSQTPMTGAQIKTAGLVFCEDKRNNLGVGGWKYEKGLMARPEIRDALAAIKERL